MCVDEGVEETHKCVNACPVCYFLTPDNVLQLLSGASIELGIVDLFVEVAQVGCRMCFVLSKLWEMNDEIFQPGAKISVRLQEDAPPAFMWALLFEISQPLDFRWMSEGSGAIRDKKFKSWAVPFGVYSKGSKWLDHFISIRPPDPSVAHDDVFDTFKARLQTCLSEHKDCKKPDTKRHPSRLIVLDQDRPDRVFVRNCTSNDQSDYVALSYCWGTTIQTRLLEDNVDEFSSFGLTVNTLPKTIQDAVISTRKLGLRHLWIDSLCIIQDSIEDKDKEIANMANIYKNATITISAAAATDCAQGFLEDRAEVELRLTRSMCLPFLTTTDEETCAVIDWIYLCPDPHMGHKVKRFTEEVINTRAWTYQESTLAPRLLIFGSGPPQWHCKEMWSIYGLNMHPENLPKQECSTTTMKITTEHGSIVPEQTLRYAERADAPKDDIGLWLTWSPMLENYSHRGMSYRADKLLALSALAAEYQSAENGSYAAGLWTATLPRSLLWRRLSTIDKVEGYTPEQVQSLNWLRSRLYDESSETELPTQTGDFTDDFNALMAASASPAKEPQGGPSRKSFLNFLKKSYHKSKSTDNASDEANRGQNPGAAQYIAPSWSPMSCTDPICFEKAASQEENIFHTSLAKINNINVEPATNLNPFGRLNFGYLDITAPMCCMSWLELTADFVICTHGEPFVYWDYVIPDEPALFEYLFNKYDATFNPQTLADRNIQHPIDEGDCSIMLSEGGTRWRMPVKQEMASKDCAEANDPFIPVQSVKKEILNAVLNDKAISQKSSGKKNRTTAEYDECEFWLLEVERSMSPAGLVLKRVRGDIFARVGYFAVNSSMDPEIVCLPGRVQTRGRKTWNWGGPEKKNTWNDRLEKRRIYLV